jgi:molybdenum cofactor sulfurtransferase
MIPNLLALPLECNFGGQRQELVKAATTTSWRQAATETNRPWYILWDIAKAVATGPDVSLRLLDADFAVLSLYKIIGAPTGLGCLLVKRDIINTWLGQTGRPALPRYYGGGAVDLVLPRTNVTLPKSTPSPLRALASGTSHFRGIVAVEHGLDVIQHELGGMTAVHQHVTTLAMELVARLRGLRHANGKAVVQIYGGWATYNFSDDNDDSKMVEPRINRNKNDSSAQSLCNNTTVPGPTVAFNVRRQDGSYVGYNEVAKLAALNRPAPIQLRVGCLCNPGACHDALQVDEDTVLEHYRKTGHVCGDDIDLVDGQPTGVVRASFGKDSLWEDLDALVTFIERVFVASSNKIDSGSDWDGAPRYGVVVEQYIYPIKSCAAQRVPEWTLHTATSRLSYDREFALVDASGIAMRLQRYPQMAFIEPTVSLHEKTMTVRAPNMPDLKISLDPETSSTVYGQGIVQVCGNKCTGVVWGDLAVSQWFSDFLQVECWLARFRDDDGSYELPKADAAPATAITTKRDRKVAFANEQPLLLISKQAVDLLNSMLESQKERQVTSRHFRPNFVVSIQSPQADQNINEMETAHAEDGWHRVQYTDRNGLSFDVVGQCARCSMVDVDPRSGMKGHTLRALADYRRNNGQINFGIFLKGSAKVNGARYTWVREGDTFACE